MNLTRRLFSALIPAAPVGVAAARSGLGSPIDPTPPIDMTRTIPGLQAGSLVNRVVREVAPPAYKKYMEAQEAMQMIRNHRYRRNDMLRYGQHQIDPDIMALKSISFQHKIRMQIKKEDDERKQEQSFMEALAESLGLKEYLEKRNKLEYDDGPKAASNW